MFTVQFLTRYSWVKISVHVQDVSVNHDSVTSLNQRSHCVSVLGLS